jgi:hypothetical protein
MSRRPRPINTINVNGSSPFARPILLGRVDVLTTMHLIVTCSGPHGDERTIYGVKPLVPCVILRPEETRTTRRANNPRPATREWANDWLPARRSELDETTRCRSANIKGEQAKQCVKERGDHSGHLNLSCAYAHGVCSGLTLKVSDGGQPPGAAAPPLGVLAGARSLDRLVGLPMRWI